VAVAVPAALPMPVLTLAPMRLPVPVPRGHHEFPTARLRHHSTGEEREMGGGC